MDFTPELLAFQGLIISADNIQSFSKIAAKGGNEESIKYIVGKLLKFFEDRQYVTKNGIEENSIKEMRKFALYIILNSDLPVLEDMVEMEGIDLVIWTIPTITKFLMCELFWNLHMNKFLYEIIVFCYAQLALEVAEPFIHYIKYFTPVECLDKVKLVSAACYRLICRLHFFNFENNTLSNELIIALNSYQKCLNYFTDPPNAEKLNRLSKDELYMYKGKCLHTLLLLIFECLERYTSIEEFRTSGFDNIYLLTHKEENLKNNSLTFCISESPNKLIVECLNKCNIALFDKCQELIMDISVDIFCAWSEFEENGKSMQHTIGELCYKLHTNLTSISCVSEHPLNSMLEQISCKPVDFKDIISSTDTDTIIENIHKNNEEKYLWVRALVHKEDLCYDKALVEEVASNLKVLNEEECYGLYNVVCNHLNQCPERSENIEMLAIKAFLQCNITTKYKILEEHFKENTFFDNETVGFNNTMTEICNKLIVSPDTELSDILSVFIQSPQKVYTKIFNLAAENTQQTAIMLRVMKILEKFSNHHYKLDTESCVIKIAREFLGKELDTEVKQHNFINFICDLKNAHIIPEAQLLILIIMPNLHEALLNKDIVGINIHTRLLNISYSLEELLQYRAPMLAMLAQMLDAVRWKLHNYVAIGPATLQHILQLQTSLFGTYHAEIPGKECNWLKTKIKNIQPLNLYYYSKLWNAPGNNFIEVITGSSIHKDTDIVQLTTWVSQVICSCTQQEWCSIWDSLTVFGDTVILDIFHDALSMLTLVVAEHWTETTWACLLYCCRNFVFITRYKYLKEPLTDNQVVTVCDKIATTANLVDEEHVKAIGTLMLPLFAYIAERKKDYSVDIAHYLSNKLRHSNFLITVNQVFANGTV